VTEPSGILVETEWIWHERSQKMRTKPRANLLYIVGIIILIAFGILIWWALPYVVPQLSVFLLFVLGYGAAVLALSALGFRIIVNLKYLVVIIVLTGCGALTWYAEANIAPQLGIFFGFVLAYVAAVLVLMYILGRHGG
jgi:hypothetical protein